MLFSKFSALRGNFFLMATVVQGIAKKMDVEQKKNAPKRVFCRKYDGYEEFCKGETLEWFMHAVLL